MEGETGFSALHHRLDLIGTSAVCLTWRPDPGDARRRHPIVPGAHGLHRRAQSRRPCPTRCDGIIETSSGGSTRSASRSKRWGPDRQPWGVNIAQLFTHVPGLVDFVAENGVRFVTTSAATPRSTPTRCTPPHHRLPRHREACGRQEGNRRRVDGLVVEVTRVAGQGDGRGIDDGAAALVASHTDLPLIARRRICDARTLARLRARRRGRADGTRMLTRSSHPCTTTEAVGARCRRTTPAVRRRPGAGDRVLRTPGCHRPQRRGTRWRTRPTRSAGWRTSTSAVTCRRRWPTPPVAGASTPSVRSPTSSARRGTGAQAALDAASAASLTVLCRVGPPGGVNATKNGQTMGQG